MGSAVHKGNALPGFEQATSVVCANRSDLARTREGQLQQIRDKKLAVAFHGWKVRAARNVQRTDKITTLCDVDGWSVLPTSPFFSLQCGGDGYRSYQFLNPCHVPPVCVCVSAALAPSR